MNAKQSLNTIAFTVLVIGTMLLSWQILQAEEFTQQTPLPDVNALADWSPPGDDISSGSINGDLPQVSYSSTNNEIVVVFNGWIGSNEESRDPYFVVSSDDGSSWGNATNIESDSNAKSTAYVTHDSGGDTHAVWLSLNGTTNTYTVSHGIKDSSSNSVWSTEIIDTDSSDPLPPGVLNAVIATGQSNDLDIVWEGIIDSFNPNPTLWHSHYNGATWSTKARVFVSPDDIAKNPAIESDSSGNIHLVWEQESGANLTQIYYAQYDGSWSTPVLLSTDSISSNNAHTPDIELSDNEIHVSFAVDLEDSSSDLQTVYQRTCNLASNCASSGNWNSLTNISSQALEVNQDTPFYIFPSMAYVASADDMVLVFHGIRSGSTGANELVWQNTSCNNWINVDSVTSTSAQSVNPRLAIESSTMHLVYEDINSEQIYYMQDSYTCEAGLINYLPLITR